MIFGHVLKKHISMNPVISGLGGHGNGSSAYGGGGGQVGGHGDGDHEGEITDAQMRSN